MIDTLPSFCYSLGGITPKKASHTFMSRGMKLNYNGLINCHHTVDV